MLESKKVTESWKNVTSTQVTIDYKIHGLPLDIVGSFAFSRLQHDIGYNFQELISEGIKDISDKSSSVEATFGINWDYEDFVLLTLGFEVKGEIKENAILSAYCSLIDKIAHKYLSEYTNETGKEITSKASMIESYSGCDEYDIDFLDSYVKP